MEAMNEIITIRNTTQVVMSSTRHVGSGKVVFVTSTPRRSRSKGGFLILGDLAVIQTARILRWKISAGVASVRRDPWSLITSRGRWLSQRSTSDVATAGDKPEARGITNIDELSHQRSAGQTFLEDPRTGGREQRFRVVGRSSLLNPSRPQTAVAV